MRFKHAALLAALSIGGLGSACAPEDPYIWTDYRYHQKGQVIVCYNEETASLEKVTAMAETVCAQYDRRAQVTMIQSNQCSFTAPSQAVFACVPRPGETPPPIIRHNAPMRHDPVLPE